MKNIWKKHKLWIAVAVIFIVAVVIGSVVTPSAAPSVVKLIGFGPAGLIPGQYIPTPD
jgi:ABC-type Co2+ transport system permease subunit